MPQILERLVSQLRSRGQSESSAYAIATSTLQKRGMLKKGTNTATPKGVRRGKMSPSARAKDRAAKYSKKHKPKDYNYNKATNLTKLKRAA